MTVPNKKIVVVVQSLISVGGLAAFVRDQIVGYKKLGWDVEVIVTNHRGNNYEIIASIVKCHDLTVLPLSISKVKKFASLVNELCPDILQCNNVSLAHYAFPLLNQSIKTVVIVHSPDVNMLRVDRLFFRYIWRWVVPSPGLVDILKTILPDKVHSRIKVIPHGVNSNIFNASLRKDFNDINNAIVFCGSFLPHKGVDSLPYIFADVVKVYPQIKLIIIGKGQSKAKILEKLEKMGLMNNVVWCEVLSQKGVAKLFSKADILLLPTRVESFGLIIVEAMLMGLVPVVSKLRGITDSIIVDRVSGFLIEPDDKNAFAQKIIELYKNEELLLKMRKDCILGSKDKFSLANMFSDYEKLYREKNDRIVILPVPQLVWLLEVIKTYLINWFRKRSIFKNIENAKIYKILNSNS